MGKQLVTDLAASVNIFGSNLGLSMGQESAAHANFGTTLGPFGCHLGTSEDRMMGVWSCQFKKQQWF